MTSAGIGLDLTEEVDRLLSRPRTLDYQNLVKVLTIRFEEFALRSAPLSPIYRVYSRASKQGGDELKERWKIAEKVSLIRMGKRKNRDGSLRDVTPKPAFPIQDLGDIVGLTVVCIFPSDISVVMRCVEDLVSRGELLQFESEPKTEGGYYAHHFVLGLPQSPFGRAYRCEVQVKTILHDAWSAKTHDLTYKPEAELDERMKLQMDHLGDALNAIDRMSEVLKTLITERWKVDHVRKNAAGTALLLRLREVKRPTDPQKAQQFDDILNELEANREALSTASRTQVDEIVARIQSFVAGGPDNYDSCRMISALACMRTDNDLDNLALYHIERWVAAAEPPSKYDSLLFQGLVLFCFSRLEEAIVATKEALRIAQESGNDRCIAQAAGNLAYWFAELGPSELGRRLNAAPEARGFVQLYEEAIRRADAKPTDDGDLSADQRAMRERIKQADRAKLKDTTGIVSIAFGESAVEVREGLRLCTEARAEDPYRDVADAYFEIHERRAFRRLLTWP